MGFAAGVRSLGPPVLLPCGRARSWGGKERATLSRSPQGRRASAPAWVWGDSGRGQRPDRPPEELPRLPLRAGPAPFRVPESQEAGAGSATQRPPGPPCRWRCSPRAAARGPGSPGSAATGVCGGDQRRLRGSCPSLSPPRRRLFSFPLHRLPPRRPSEGHGRAGSQGGAAAAPRVQRQLRGVAARVQRARLPAAARAAPAGAQDAARAPGPQLQVGAGAGARPPRPDVGPCVRDASCPGAGGSVVLCPKPALVSGICLWEERVPEAPSLFSLS